MIEFGADDPRRFDNVDLASGDRYAEGSWLLL